MECEKLPSTVKQKPAPPPKPQFPASETGTSGSLQRWSHSTGNSGSSLAKQRSGVSTSAVRTGKLNSDDHTYDEIDFDASKIKGTEEKDEQHLSRSRLNGTSSERPCDGISEGDDVTQKDSYVKNSSDSTCTCSSDLDCTCNVVKLTSLVLPNRFVKDYINKPPGKATEKPPLLPKPVVSTTVTPTSPKLSTAPRIKDEQANLKPAIVPKCPELLLWTEKRNRELNSQQDVSKPKSYVTSKLSEKGKYLSPLLVKSPVLKFGEANNLNEFSQCGSPVRPPRSPRQKVLESPFSCADEKPALPVKKKYLQERANQDTHTSLPIFTNSSSSVTRKLEIDKRKSASLGRTPTLAYQGFTCKTASLERNRVPEFPSCPFKYSSDDLLIDSSLDHNRLGELKNGPVPPPRRTKKKSLSKADEASPVVEEHSNPSDNLSIQASKVFPIYAEVNYNLKKNRRQLSQSNAPDEISKSDSVQYVESVPNSTNSSWFDVKLFNATETKDDNEICLKNVSLDKNSDQSCSVHEEVSYHEVEKSTREDLCNTDVQSNSVESTQECTTLDVSKEQSEERDETKDISSSVDHTTEEDLKSSATLEGTLSNASQLEECVPDGASTVESSAVRTDSKQKVKCEQVIKVEASTQANIRPIKRTNSSKTVSEICNLEKVTIVQCEDNVTGNGGAICVDIQPNRDDMSDQHSEMADKEKQRTESEEKCSDSCEWMSAEALDESVSSSKLEFQSANLSLHSSESDTQQIESVVLPNSDTCDKQSVAGIKEMENEFENVISYTSEKCCEMRLNPVIEDDISQVLKGAELSIQQAETILLDFKNGSNTLSADGSEHVESPNDASSIKKLEDSCKEITTGVKCFNLPLHDTSVSETLSNENNTIIVQQPDKSTNRKTTNANGARPAPPVISTQNISSPSAVLLVKCKASTNDKNKQVYRRQSWSDSRKDDSPSPESISCRRRKHKSRSWWCDEDDLSSGAMGDVDSSDAAHHSSFDECIGGSCSDTEGSSPVRRKFAALFGSFGKGVKKSSGGYKTKDRKEICNSQFYCNPPDSSDTEETPVEANSSKNDLEEDNSFQEMGTSDRENDGSCQLVPDQRLKDNSLLKVDECKELCDNSSLHESCSEKSHPDTTGTTAAITEESFENDAHSESENEDNYHTAVPDGSAESLLSEEQRKAKKAFYIAQEIMTSEKVFIDVLKLLNVDFRRTVEGTSKESKHAVIPEADLCKILNFLPQLQSLNEDILHDLESRIENWSCSQKIADVIVKKGPFLKLYNSYIQNFETQCNFFDDCCQKYGKFAKVVKDFETSQRCQKLSLKHYMLKPIQRIPQYRLLLEDYLRHLSPESLDFEDTQTALRIVSDVADHANRSMKQGDHFSKLLQLQSLLGNFEVIKPGREFLKEGELLKLCRKGMQPRYFILLNDCLLYTTYCNPGPGFKVNYELPLAGMKVSIPVAEDYKNEFSIISKTRSFTLAAQSLQERSVWVDALQGAIKDYILRQLTFMPTNLSTKSSKQEVGESFKLGHEAPVWIQDRRVTMCQSCTAEFTVTFRRHHCRACGKVVCGNCSANRAPLRYMKFHSERVCDDCYETLLKEFEASGTSLREIIKKELQTEGNSDVSSSLEYIRSQFKKYGPSGKKNKKYIPQRLKEVCANDAGSQMSGWLQRRSRRSWKRMWFVLKEQVLYVYRASEDVVALESIPILGYEVESFTERHFELYEGVEARLVFQLKHKGQPPLVFHADSPHLVKRWIDAMQEATVLK